MARDAGEISELAQNRLAIDAGYAVNVCGGDAVTTDTAGAQHDQLYQLTPSGVANVSTLPDTLTTPLGSLWKLYVYAWLEDTHQPEQPYQCRGNSPEEVYCCQAGRALRAKRRWCVPVVSTFRRSGCTSVRMRGGNTGNSARHQPG